jgi:hypothetical protein
MNKDNKNTKVNNTDKKLHISDVSGSALDDNILKVLLGYNDYLFTFIDRDNVGIGTEKEDVIKWYNEHYR